MFFGIILMLFGCSEDLFDDISQKSKRDYKIKEISISELSLNQEFTKAYSKISKSNFEIQISTTNKTQIENDYGFTIIDEPAKVIEYDNKTSYSLLIKTDSTQTNELKNLVIEVDSLNKSTNFIITYKLDESSENHINTNEQIIIEEIAFDPNTNVSSRYNSDCMDVIVIYCSDASQYCGGADTQYGCYRRTTTICSASGASDFGASENVLTSPVDINHGHGGGNGIDEVLVTPCSSLKKVNLKVKSSLSNLSINAATAEHGEYGYSFQVNSSNSLTLPVELAYSPLSQIGIPTFNNIYGAAHTHPLSAFYMFSFSDVYTLLSLYSAANTTIKKDVVFMLINPDGSTYAIKIDDIDVFTFNMQAKLNATGIYGSNPQPKVNAADRKLNEIYNNTSDPTDSNKLARVFLEHFNGSGMSLYKSTGNFDGWKKLSLPTNPSSPTLTESPCN